MLDTVLQFIQDEELFQPKQERLLLALSGGVDSVVLAHICKNMQADFALAHCNFQLRGEESEADAHFAQALAKQLDVPFFSVRFDTQKLAEQSRESIQMLARELRYNWLQDCLQSQGYDYILTGHHINDSIETLLLNLSKGCGLKGLHGILPKRGNIARPLLCLSKEDILEYAQEHGLEYREDSSNKKENYQRNSLRLKVLPVLKQINPSLEITFAENFQRFRELEGIYDFGIAHFKRLICRWKEQGRLYIDLIKLRQCPAPQTLLFEILSPYGFNASQVRDMWKQDGRMRSGRIFQSESHKLLIDRGHYILQERKEQEQAKPYLIEKLRNGRIESPFGHFELRVYPREELGELEKNRNRAYFDAEELQLPLKLRNWRSGDSFQPFGMRGKHRKLSDFFNDLKVSRFEKEASAILESGTNIAWVVGYRIDNRYALREESQWVAEFLFHPIT